MLGGHILPNKTRQLLQLLRHHGSAGGARHLCTLATILIITGSGAVLDLEYEINKGRGSRKMLRKLPQGVYKTSHMRIARDYHSDYIVDLRGSPADRVDILELHRIWETRCLIWPDTDNEQAV